MFERFTDKARKVVVLAQEEARSFNHTYIGTEHMLLGVIMEEEGGGAKSLEKFGITKEKVRSEIEEVLGKGQNEPGGHIPFTPRAKKVLELSLRTSFQLGNEFIGTEHILLGILKEGEGVAAQVLLKLGVDFDQLRQQVIQELGGERFEKKESVGAGPVGAGSVGAFKPTGNLLEQYGRNLTELAKNGKLDPVIGREKEVERIIQVLCRRTKNNPVLVGEPGVGKTAVIEGLAQRIVKDEVPEILTNKQIYSLDMGSLVAGARYRGEFEDRLKKVLKEIRSRADILLFIDEIHTLVGAGSAEGAIDAASILKPLLARGELQTIGATTLDEYKKHFEKDAALERRFQKVVVEEPSLKETIEILKGLRDRYESYHKVSITDKALEAAATLAQRYIVDRFMPDKAIDLLDEAGARLNIKRTQKENPEIELLQKRILLTRKEKEKAVNEQNFQEAGIKRDEEKALEKEKERKEEVPEINEEEIALVLEAWTGIPAVRLSEEETKRLLKMEKELHKRIIGQEEAIKSLSRAIRRTRAGLKDPKRPSGSFIFAGPSGVGKTELSKTLAEFLFGEENALITLDMSEYMEKHTVSRMLGAPPGYVGYEEGGQLSEKVRRKPFSVVLFDEIEKAHPDVFNTLLQILEDGRLTDSSGRVVDFKNTVIILTSNLGTRDISKGFSVGFQNKDETGSYERMKEKVLDELKRNFKPEFLNRVDDIIVFSQLKEEEILEIVDLMLKRVKEQLLQKEMHMQISSEAKKLLATKGYDAVLGARPLRRTIQREIEDALSEKILFGSLKKGDIFIGEKDGVFTFNNALETKSLVEEEMLA